VRTRWELGHMSVAMAKGLGFISICLAQLLWPRLP
jgi:hypothetical protein